jgi:hypothetical protein
MNKVNHENKLLQIAARIVYFNTNWLSILYIFIDDPEITSIFHSPNAEEVIENIFISLITLYISYECINYNLSEVKNKKIDYIVIAISLLFGLAFILF